MISIGQKRKAQRIAILSVGALLFVAVLCFVFGFAIAEGWEAVGRWFTSKWAALAIVAVAVVAIGLVYAYFALKDHKDFRK